MTASMNTYNTRNASNIPLLKVKDNFFENSFFFLLQLSNGTRPKKIQYLQGKSTFMCLSWILWETAIEAFWEKTIFMAVII